MTTEPEKIPTTRKIKIIEKYAILEVELKKHITSDLFPNLEDIDIADLVFIITYTFMGVNTLLQYDNKIREMMKDNNIDVINEKMETIAPLVKDFVVWLKNL